MRYQAALRSDCRMALIALCFSARKRKSRIFEAEQKRNKRTAVAGLGAEITTEITTGSGGRVLPSTDGEDDEPPRFR